MNPLYQKYQPNPSHERRAVITFLVVGIVVGLVIGKLWTKAEASYAPAQHIGSSTTTGFVIGIGQLPPPEIATQDVEFKLFWDAWSIIKDRYYQQPVTDKTLFYGAMKGMTEAMGDPYTDFFEPKGAEEFQQALSGKFYGIGAEIGIKDDIITVVAPLPDTPADKAGLKAGDLIAKINGNDTKGFSVEQAVSMIRGDKGTKVTLTLFRPSTKKTFDVDIIRDEIQVKSVSLKWVDGKKIAIITVTNFNADTKDNFDKAVDDAVRGDAKGVILDLRNDPGGFLDTAVYMAGEWVGDNIVVKERKQGQIFEELRGTGKKRLAGIPTVVLVNGGSASASEIVTGALQDYKVATVVGTKTFGKGSVQDYVNLKDGSAIKITIAEWLTPNERTINKTGLQPDVTIDLTNDDYEKQRDPQLDRAVGILTGEAPASEATSTQAKP